MNDHEPPLEKLILLAVVFPLAFATAMVLVVFDMIKLMKYKLERPASEVDKRAC